MLAREISLAFATNVAFQLAMNVLSLVTNKLSMIIFPVPPLGNGDPKRIRRIRRIRRRIRRRRLV